MNERAKCPNGTLLMFKIILEEEIAHGPVFGLR
jgi:hypothetical protein